MAPFYSQIPYFNRLRCNGDLEELARASGKGIAKSLIAFCLGVIAISYGVPVIFEIIGSQISFIDTGLWYLMAVVWLLERHHGMHTLQCCKVWNCAMLPRSYRFVSGLPVERSLDSMVHRPVNCVFARIWFVVVWRCLGLVVTPASCKRARVRQCLNWSTMKYLARSSWYRRCHCTGLSKLK